ncbi:MAG: PEP/pyruvate-binding domain-containing protein, partial [Streptosporangiaceae bacterium]
LLKLSDPEARSRGVAGSKAAALATLCQAGFPVPDGTVLTTSALEALESLGASGEMTAEPIPATLRAALDALGERYGTTPVAVRSSALAEDRPDATFAGQYVTVLDVLGPAAIEAAVRSCWNSLISPAASAYRQHAQDTGQLAMAVLIQPMVQAEAAGVALGADPLTGDRSRALISAVRGLAAPLVSGQAAAEDWDVTDAGASCRRTDPGVLTPDQAAAVAAVLRRVEDLMGAPQDLEWAIAAGEIFILQARPMTAVPPRPAWPAPRRGVWLRTIRLGEWLPEPITPLFDTWLLERLEGQFLRCQKDQGGINAPPPLHVTVNGWYFHSPIGSGRQTLLFRGMLRRPRLAIATTCASRLAPVADRLFFRDPAGRWQRDVLIPYQGAVAHSEQQMQSAPAPELIRMVDQLADRAGDFFWWFTLCGGAAWRFEIALARFHHRHLAGKVDHSYQVLLGGLGLPGSHLHSVHSLDWFRETIGELPSAARGPQHAATRHEEAATRRRGAEADCRAALAPRPRLQARFMTLLALAQRYATIRAEQAAWFTLAWPVLRQCVRRLGSMMASDGVLGAADDVFFTTREELDDYLTGSVAGPLEIRVRDRRAAWEAQRRLAPPLSLGKPPLLLAKVLLSSPKVARPARTASASALRGTPASPGSASGPVRVLREPADVQAVLPGDVVVVAAAVPALTPVFDRIAALCVDGSSVAAHSSLVAREYGIPAVIGLGDATSRLSDNTWVFVDGTAGVIDVQ